MTRSSLHAPTHLRPAEDLQDRLVRGVLTLFLMVAFWSDRARQRRQLGALPAHLLDDIGIDAAAARREARKPFWRG